MKCFIKTNSTTINPPPIADLNNALFSFLLNPTLKEFSVIQSRQKKRFWQQKSAV